jgi:hypothetical protein
MRFSPYSAHGPDGPGAAPTPFVDVPEPDAAAILRAAVTALTTGAPLRGAAALDARDALERAVLAYVAARIAAADADAAAEAAAFTCAGRAVIALADADRVLRGEPPLLR